MMRIVRRLSVNMGTFLNGFLEGDQFWGRVRLAVVLGFMVLLPMMAALNDMAVQLADPLASVTQGRLVHYLTLLFSFRSLRFVWISLFALSTAIMVSTSYVQDVYELRDYRAAFRYILASVFALGYPILHISDGKKQLRPDEVNPLAEIGGPGFVLISPGSAVLFERLSHPSNVRAAGFHFISRFESIKEIIDLNDQHWHVDKVPAMSKDGLLINVHDFQFRYRLWGSRRQGGITGRNPVIPYPFSTQAVRNLVYNRSMTVAGLPAWGQAAQLAIDGVIQNYIRQNTVDAVTAPPPGSNPREEIRQAILATHVRGALRNIGTQLVWVDIGSFSVENPAVEAQRIQTWGARWEGEADLLRAKGDAFRQAMIEKARAQAQADLLVRIGEALSELDPEVRFEDRERMARLFLIKVMQVMDELRRNHGLPPTTGNPEQ